MKKAILMITAAGILGSAVLIPTPAAAYLWLFPALAAQEKKDFKAVNPYAVKAKKAKKAKKM